MRMVMARAYSNKITLFLTAFILAVSGLIAAMPLILSENASALAMPVVVTTKDELKQALADPDVDTIKLGADISTDETLVLARSDVFIDGQGKTLTFTGDTDGWQGHYVLQVYNATDVDVESLRVSGGDAGILINGSQVTISGDTYVDGFAYGGVEVSKGGAAGLANSALKLEGNIYTSTEAYGKPLLWLVDGQGSVDTIELNQTLTVVANTPAGQNWYYLQESNSVPPAPETTPPSVSVSNSTASTTVTPQISGTAGDSAVKVYLTINGGDPIEENVVNGLWVHTFSSQLPAGEYTISVVAEDAAGKRTVQPATAVLTVTAPQPLNTNNGNTPIVEPEAPVTPPVVETQESFETFAAAVPSFTSPTTNSAITQNANEAVEGATTKNVAVGAGDVNSEANKGSFLGMSWYWWLLIIAGVATIIWWIGAASRKRQSEY